VFSGTLSPTQSINQSDGDADTTAIGCIRTVTDDLESVAAWVRLPVTDTGFDAVTMA